MTRDEIISLVLSRLGKRGNNAFLVNSAGTELALIQRRLEKGQHKPIFLLSEETPLVVAANTRLAVTLPTDFLQEWEFWPLALYDSTAAEPYTYLRKDDYDLLQSQYASDEPGTPKAYSLVGSTKAAVFALSDVAREARLVYFKKEDELSDSIQENAWTEEADDWLIAELGVVMSRYARSDLLNEFKADRVEAMNRVFYDSIARENAAREAYRGDKET